jgi:hypothetical protein
LVRPCAVCLACLRGIHDCIHDSGAAAVACSPGCCVRHAHPVSCKPRVSGHVCVAPPCADTPVRIRVVYAKANGKAVSTFLYTFPKRPSLARVRQLIEEKHLELQRQAYALKSGEDDITDESWPALDLTPPHKEDTYFTITAVSGLAQPVCIFLPIGVSSNVAMDYQVWPRTGGSNMRVRWES